MRSILDSKAGKFYDGHPRRRRQVLCTSSDYSRRPSKVRWSHLGRDEGSFDIHARTAGPIDQSAQICARLGEDILRNFVDTTRMAIH